MSRAALIKKGIDKLRKFRPKKNVQETLAGKNRSESIFKRKELLDNLPRYSNGRPIPQLEPVSKLKGNLMKDLKKYSDKPLQSPAPITQKVNLPSEPVFGRKPIK